MNHAKTNVPACESHAPDPICENCGGTGEIWGREVPVYRKGEHARMEPTIDPCPVCQPEMWNTPCVDNFLEEQNANDT